MGIPYPRYVAARYVDEGDCTVLIYGCATPTSRVHVESLSDVGNGDTGGF